MQSARLYSSRTQRAQLQSGTVNRNAPPLIMIAFTTSLDASRGDNLCRQRGVDRPCVVTGSAPRTSARAMGAITGGGREATHVCSCDYRDVYISRSQRQSGCSAGVERIHL